MAIIERIDAIIALEAFTGQFQQHCIITNPGAHLMAEEKDTFRHSTALSQKAPSLILGA